MRQLLKNPLRKKLLDCFRSGMPEVAAAADAGRAVLMQHYAPALVSCADWPDLLAAHREATSPGRATVKPCRQQPHASRKPGGQLTRLAACPPTPTYFTPFLGS